MGAKEFRLGNKAKELYLYSKQAVRPVPDNKVSARDVAQAMRTIASAKSLGKMVGLLHNTAERLSQRPGRRRFPKSETFDLIADIRSTAAAILKGVHEANETDFKTEPDVRLKHIKGIIDDCNLLLQYVNIALELGYIDIRRGETWTKKVLDVKYMSLAWRKKDRARAYKLHREEDARELKRLVALVRGIIAEEKGAL